jgi:hypothetical protein
MRVAKSMCLQEKSLIHKDTTIEEEWMCKSMAGMKNSIILTRERWEGAKNSFESIDGLY